jgi:superfamily II DNA or RNA helicase
MDEKKKEIIMNEFKNYDLILVDEAHAVATQTFMTALS